ncbi:unnamed protein product [Callosobruchus maculatus]|uniref:SWIM-type domain-containing protein n=1 Tax=Callosobruchus maculatus TaxID=64391 RepID=A0A653DE75_CALMS|nr:unnamed protein product [Callosobruchus maculatus]
MEEGFVKGQSDNLPKIDIYTVMEFFSTNSSYTSAEIKGVKLWKAGRESDREDAIGYVQVKCEGTKCIVKCRVTPEHKVKSKPYHCTLVCDENDETIESVLCHDCAAKQGGCKHSVAFLIWLFKKSEEPASTSVKCYWMKPALFKVGSSIKFIKAKDFKNESSSNSNIKEDPSFLNKYNECKRRQNNKTQLMTYFTDVRIEMKGSLHYLLCKYNSSKNILSVKGFIEFCKHNISEQQCVLIEKATKDQSDSPLWFELRYRRITASIAHEASKCKTFDGVLMEKILGSYQFREPIAIKRGI